MSTGRTWKGWNFLIWLLSHLFLVLYTFHYNVSENQKLNTLQLLGFSRTGVTYHCRCKHWNQDLLVPLRSDMMIDMKNYKMASQLSTHPWETYGSYTYTRRERTEICKISQWNPIGWIIMHLIIYGLKMHVLFFLFLCCFSSACFLFLLHIPLKSKFINELH